MDVAPIEVGDESGVSADDRAVYRVRVWTAPAERGFAWMVDEWEIRHAESVTAVLEWATAHASGAPTEILVQWIDHATTENGELVARKRFTRIHGAPADDGGTTETIAFSSAT
jgi:hypothetical protein